MTEVLLHFIGSWDGLSELSSSGGGVKPSYYHIRLSLVMGSHLEEVLTRGETVPTSGGDSQ